MVVLFKPFIALVTYVTGMMGIGPAEAVVGSEKPNIARYIANSHTLFNVVNALFFLCVLPFLVRAAIWLTPGKEHERGLEDLGKPKYLDKKYLDNPSVALALARDETVRMTNIAQTMFHQVTEVLFTRKLGPLSRWRQSEDALDNLQREITEYLVGISQGSITEEESREMASLMRMTNNVERFGDAVENVAELIEEMIEENLQLTTEGMRDYKEIRSQVSKFIELVLRSMQERDRDIMETAQQMEDSIDEMRERMRDNHVSRLRSGTCTVDPGLVFVDMLSNFEKMGDYLYNVSQGVAGVK
jgi:phosphate:Na+ symporter